MCYVAVDVPIPSPRGSSTHVTGVAKALGSLGADVFVLARRTGPLQPSLEEFEGFTLRRVYRGIMAPLFSRSAGTPRHSGQTEDLNARLYRFYLSTVLALYCGFLAARLIKSNKLSVVIERETSYGAGALASLLTGAPLILEANGPRFSPISARRASRVISYSYSLVGPRLKDKTTLIDSGVDAEAFRPDEVARRAIRSRLGIGDSPIIGYVGTFQAWHGVDDLIQASGRVLGRYPSARFLMVGPGFEEMERLTARMGVSAAFVFTGPVSHDVVPQYINAADVMVSPANPAKGTWTKTHGVPTQVKVFEYMACRKPVIVTATGPMQRLVRDGETGLLVPPGDSSALADAICRLLGDNGLADSMAESGYLQILEEHTWSEHAKAVLGTIRSALGGR